RGTARTGRTGSGSSSRTSRTRSAPSGSARRPAPSLPPDVAELDEHHRGQDREQEERGRRALAEISADQAGLVGEGGEEVRGVHRAASGEHLHDVEVGEGEDGREEDDNREDGPEERQRDVT